MEYPLVEQAAKLLRRHGVNAYEQQGELVLYTNDSVGLIEVERFFKYVIEDTNTFAKRVVEWIGKNLDEHTHND